MTTGAIIAIVVVALIVHRSSRLHAARACVRRPKFRSVNANSRRAASARPKSSVPRPTARERQASEAEQRARIAAKEAEAERAQAELHQERAGLHERGMADHELIDESERERFAGTSAMNGRHDRDGDGVDDRREARHRPPRP